MPPQTPKDNQWYTAQDLAKTFGGAPEEYGRAFGKLILKIFAALRKDHPGVPHEQREALLATYLRDTQKKSGEAALWEVSEKGLAALQRLKLMPEQKESFDLKTGEDDNKIKKSLPEHGWKTANQLKDMHGGSRRTHEKDMHELRDSLMVQIMAKTPGVESRQVEQEIESRYFKTVCTGRFMTLAASPAAQELLQEKRKERRRFPDLEPDWMTPLAIENQHGGYHKTHEKGMRRTRAKLVDEIAEGVTNGNKEAADAIVEKHLIGMRQSRAFDVLAASPDAVRNLPVYPKIEPGWITGNMMRYQYGGRNVVMTADLKRYRDHFIDEAVKGGMNNDAAEDYVERTLIGMRQQPEGGAPTLAASPEALRRMLDPNRPWIGRSTILRKIRDNGEWKGMVHPVPTEEATTSPSR